MMHIGTSLHWFLIGLASAIFLFFCSPMTASADFQTDPNCDLALGAWQTAPVMSPADTFHLEGGSVVIDDRLYLLSGYNSGNPFTVYDRVSVYDFTTDSWMLGAGATPFGAIPVGNTHVQATSDGQFIYMAGGFPVANGSLPTDIVRRYDTATQVWSLMPPLPQARASGGFVYNSVTNNLHYMGGLPDDRATDQPDHWTLDLANPAANWVAQANMPNPRNHFQSVEIDGKIYAVGGQTGHDGPHADTRLLHVYDPATNLWTQLADMPISRSHHETATMVVNERIVIIAGSASLEGQDQVANVTTYNPQTDTWTELMPIPMPLYGAYAGYHDGRIIVTAGGLTNFNLQQNSWSNTLVEDCAPVVVAVPTSTPSPVTNQPVTNTITTQPQISVFDPAISKIGFLLPGDLGAQDEQIEWAVTVRNNGNVVGSNIVITDTVRPELRVDDVTTSAGIATITGQTVQVIIPQLAPGETVSISIFTTVMEGGAVINNTACLTADNLDDICATGQAISQLPATGEPPLERVLFELVIGMSLVLAGMIVVLMSVANLVENEST